MVDILRPEQIRTASLYPLATLDARTAGTGRILITRYWPRGVKRERVDDWWRIVAPDTETLRCYKLTGDWDEFTRQYDTELRLLYRTRIRSGIAWLLARYSVVTLLCHEHDAPEETVRCHRRLLREMLLEQTNGGDAQ